MRTRTFFGILAGILSIALLIWLGIYAYGNIVISAVPAPASEQPAAMTAFLIARPNFIVDGSGLDRVEVWAVPAGNLAPGNDYQLIGNAALQPGSDPFTQIWTLPIPEDPIPAIEIFAKGFDVKGGLVGQMSLPYLGAIQLFNAIWGGPLPAASSSPSTQRHFPFTLKVGESATAGGLTVKLVQVEKDNRCPRTAVCIWAGEVEAKVQLVAGNRNETVNLHSMSSASTFGNYQIAITSVSPARAGIVPGQGDYRLTFSVEKT